MATKVINYLYEDLPEGHTVLASEWNNAMSLIKETINNNALAVESKADTYFELDIGTYSAPWQGSAGKYSYTIFQTTHNKSEKPQITLYDANGQILYSDIHIDYYTGNITIYSNADVTIKVIIR